MDPISGALALAQFAPSILRFFGIGERPVAVAEKIVGIAQAVTGTSSHDEAIKALAAKPELVQQFNLAVLAANTELEKSVLADTQDARKRDIEVRKLDGGKNTRADVLIGGAVLILLTCLVVLVFYRKDIPGEAVGIISTIAGLAGACLRDAFQFEFGSSRGSKEKDALLAGKL